MQTSPIFFYFLLASLFPSAHAADIPTWEIAVASGSGALVLLLCVYAGYNMWSARKTEKENKDLEKGPPPPVSKSVPAPTAPVGMREPSKQPLPPPVPDPPPPPSVVGTAVKGVAGVAKAVQTAGKTAKETAASATKVVKNTASSAGKVMSDAKEAVQDVVSSLAPTEENSTSTAKAAASGKTKKEPAEGDAASKTSLVFRATGGVR